jgi:hypothetical protein
MWKQILLIFSFYVFLYLSIDAGDLNARIEAAAIVRVWNKNLFE